MVKFVDFTSRSIWKALQPCFSNKSFLADRMSRWDEKNALALKDPFRALKNKNKLINKHCQITIRN